MKICPDKILFCWITIPFCLVCGIRRFSDIDIGSLRQDDLSPSHDLYNYLLKAQQSLPGQRGNGEGLWLNSLDYLPVCYTQCTSLTVLYVVCYQSVTRYANNSSGYVSLMWSMFEIIPKLVQVPPTGLYSPVAPLSSK